jgi:3-hydroxyacyl-[acyl-carrier-protein] dehydratase
MTKEEIISKLPYSKPFLFVDELLQIDENGVVGTYIFDENLDFYKGHFKDKPITPGVILTEVMAQIGLVCLGMEFMKPVHPNDKVTVFSEKKYFRFGKLKCKLIMKNEKEDVVCSGTIAGMIV